MAEQKKEKDPDQKKQVRVDIDSKEGKNTGEEEGYTAHQKKERVREKDAIAQYVINEVIKDGMSIFLDAGSTVHRVGVKLITNSLIQGLTIITNNMLIFNEFTERTQMMMKLGNVLALTGGVYNKNHEALFGQIAEPVLTAFSPVIVVIGASGFVVEQNVSDALNKQGAFHHDIVSEVVTKKAIASLRTLHRVVVCDYSKIGTWDASCFATIKNLSEHTDRCTIVTSVVPPELPDEDKQLYEKRYQETFNALEKMDTKNVEMIRVNYKGKKV